MRSMILLVCVSAAEAAPGVDTRCPTGVPTVSCIEAFSVSQHGDGSNPTGNSAATAWDISSFNDPNNWTDTVGTANKIGPGDCVTVLGSISGQLVPQRSGTTSNPITIVGDGQAVVSNEYVIDTSGTDWHLEMEATQGLDPIYSKDISANLPQPQDFIIRGFFEDTGVSYNGRGTCGPTDFSSVLNASGQWCRGVGSSQGTVWYTPASGAPGLIQSVTGGVKSLTEAQVASDIASAFFLEAGVSHINIRDLEISRAYGAIFTSGVGDLEIRCLTVDNIPGSALLFTQSLDRIEVIDSIIRNASDGVYFGRGGAGNLHVVRGNEIYNMGLFSVNGVGTNRNIDGHAVAARGVGDGSASYGLLVEENDLYNAESIVYVNDVCDMPDPCSEHIASEGIVVRYNKIHDAVDGADENDDSRSCLVLAGMDPDAPGVTDALVHHNEIYNCGNTPPLPFTTVSVGIAVRNVDSLKIHHNSIYNFFTNALRSSGQRAGMRNVEFKNNIVSFDDDAPGTRRLAFLGGADPSAYSNLAFDSNLYEIRCDSCDAEALPNTFHCIQQIGVDGNGNPVFDGQNVSFDHWRDVDECISDFGEQHSFIADPAFVNLPDDLDISAVSPAVGEGLDLGYPRDIEGNPVPMPVATAPDIGAYEKTQSP